MQEGAVKKHIFDRLTEVKEAPKTNNSNPSAYIGTVGFELCCKSKCLVKQDVFLILRDGKPVPYFFTPHPSKIKDFCHLLLEEKAFVRLSLEFCVLTVWGFFDTLNPQTGKPVWGFERCYSVKSL